MKKWIIGIVLIAVIAAALLLILGNRDAAPAADAEPEEAPAAETAADEEEKESTLTEDLLQQAMDSGLLTEEMLDDAADFYGRMKEETEGMSNDEAVDYWIREALALVQDELPEVKQEQISEVLEKLHEGGYLSEEAVYDAENWIFTFIYDSGIPGGVDIGEKSPVINTPQGATPQEIVPQNILPQSSTRRAPALRSAYTGEQLEVVVLNGFEEIPYRTDYYDALQAEWSGQGVSVTLDSNVTVADMASLHDYDIIVFSMHGSTYLEQPVLCVDEEATYDTDMLYYDYLAGERSVAKMLYADGTCGYWLMPAFFANRYGSDGLDGKVIFSESCCFYGCECYTDEVDPAMGSTLFNASAEVVMGYCNSVGADYSRDVMKTTLDAMFLGSTAYDALSAAMGLHGADDGWEDPAQDKFTAYPVYMGENDTVIVSDGTEEPEEPEEPEAPEAEDGAPASPDADALTLEDIRKLLGLWEQEAEAEPDPDVDWADFDLAVDTILASCDEQLIGVYAEGRRDGTFYLPYTNDTPYTFTLEVELEYLYRNSVVFEDGPLVYTLEPGDYIEIPANFPILCDAWNLWYTISDICYRGEWLY